MLSASKTKVRPGWQAPDSLLAAPGGNGPLREEAERHS